MATNFLDAAGTNGFIQAPFNLFTTDLTNITNGSAVTSSVGGASGVFSQSSWGNAVWGSVYFYPGTSFTPTAGGYIAGWFLLSPDGGTTFETAVGTPSTSVSAMPRAPDFVIPMSAAAYASGNIAWIQGRYIKVPWESHKIILQNMTGATIPSNSGNVIKGGGVAIQY